MAMKTGRQREQERRRQLAERTIDFLTSAPTKANTTVTTATFRQMLLLHDGYVMYRGKRYEVTGKSLGAGVYRVTLKEA